MAKPPTPKSGDSRRNSAASTPATADLTRAGIPFHLHQFENDLPPGSHGYGKAAAAALGVAEARVFKTLLVTVHGSGSTGGNPHAVAIVPVSGQLSLKALAAALGAKRVEMLDPPTAERITGYVVGGISPFGQRRALPTVIDSSAFDHPTVFVSGGRRGLDIEIAPASLVDVVGAHIASITTIND